MGHLQADISNIRVLESTEIMCGREISLLTGFCYRFVTAVKFLSLILQQNVMQKLRQLAV
jgi:hypothetical protein